MPRFLVLFDAFQWVFLRILTSNITSFILSQRDAMYVFAVLPGNAEAQVRLENSLVF